MNEVLIIILLVVVGLLMMFFVPQWRLKRAIRQVIRIFREHNAVGIKNAKMVDELGLRSRGMLEGILKGRDYKKHALSTLMKAEIIKITEDGRLYLLEEKLADSSLDRGVSYYR